MASEWPDWGKLQKIVSEGKYMGANTEFQTFKKKVLKASEAEIAALSEHAPLMWEFLIRFAAVKNHFRNMIIQVFNKLAQVPSWIDAWKREPALHKNLQELHEDLQAALGAQHEAIQNTMTPAAFKTMVKADEKPDMIQQAMQKERMIDEIQDESNAICDGDFETGGAVCGPLAALQEAIDVVVNINSPKKLDSTGRDGLNQLRIACIKCAGQEALFQQEVANAHQVFSFLLSYIKRSLDQVSAVSEVINQLMASPSWSAAFEASGPLKDGLRELPEEVQAAFALQHGKVMEMVTPEARRRADQGTLSDAVKQVADKMESVRFPCATVIPPPPPPPPQKNEWKEAKTPEGHCYYFNLRTRESTWERPASLGGPKVYAVGESVEVWSNSQQVWARGTVLEATTEKVVAEFTMPGGKGVAKKELPSQHKDLRHLEAADESWTPQELTAYQGYFESLPSSAAPGKAAQAGYSGAGPASPEKASADVASFLAKSGLDRRVLKQVWNVGNPMSKRHLGFEDFAGCCRLVAHCQAFGPALPIMVEADRPLRVKLRTDCLGARPPQLPKFA